VNKSGDVVKVNKQSFDAAGVREDIQEFIDHALGKLYNDANVFKKDRDDTEFWVLDKI